MTKKAFTKAQSKDYQNAKQQWLELVRLLEDNYSIKSKGKNEIYIKIPNEEAADIEILLNGLHSFHNYSAKLWYARLPENRKSLQGAEIDTLQGVIEYIDKVLLILKNEIGN
ncbi:hypothetical protein [Alkalibacterium gilvum]|uniref:hypothetical protein n=1 Tax=Alkalibacterium gilvum TaxID=1130080 RepID=UPI003F93E6BD